MKTLFLALLLTLFLSSCSLWPPKENNELEKLSEDVLNNKRGEGIEIDVKPIEKKTQASRFDDKDRSHMLPTMPD